MTTKNIREKETIKIVNFEQSKDRSYSVSLEAKFRQKCIGWLYISFSTSRVKIDNIKWHKSKYSFEYSQKVVILCGVTSVQSVTCPGWVKMRRKLYSL